MLSAEGFRKGTQILYCTDLPIEVLPRSFVVTTLLRKMRPNNQWITFKEVSKSEKRIVIEVSLGKTSLNVLANHDLIMRSLLDNNNICTTNVLANCDGHDCSRRVAQIIVYKNGWDMQHATTDNTPWAIMTVTSAPTQFIGWGWL